MKVRFANDYKTPGGRTYKAGSIHEIKNNAEARNLIHKGKAIEATADVVDASSRGQKAATGARPGNASHEEETPETSAAAETTTPPAKGKGKELSRG